MDSDPSARTYWLCSFRQIASVILVFLISKMGVIMFLVSEGGFYKYKVLRNLPGQSRWSLNVNRMRC